jgi:hypothetical protein
MKYYNFYKEDNDFNEILSDTSLKKVIQLKIRFLNHLIIGIDEHKDPNNKIASLITIKYGESMRDRINRDFTPVPYVDYLPKPEGDKWLKNR